jgi:hypothetical protein
MRSNVVWLEDVDAVEFEVSGFNAKCFMHRLAFRAVMGDIPTADTCLNFARAHLLTLQNAALDKMTRCNLDGDQNISINSRDFRRASKPNEGK